MFIGALAAGCHSGAVPLAGRTDLRPALDLEKLEPVFAAYLRGGIVFP